MTSIKLSGWERTIVGLVGLTLLGGCAVMTVDVDVYKGPLTNHPDVQTEQVVNVADGAKPLLVQLRDYLECSADYTYVRRGATWVSEPSHGGVEARVIQFREQPGYQNGYMPEGSGARPLASSTAAQVNEILSLYADQAPPELAHWYAEGNKAFTDYQWAYGVLHPIDLAPSEATWTQLARALPDTTREPRSDAGLPELRLSELIQAYRGFLTTHARDAGKVLEAARRAATAAPGFAEGLPPGIEHATATEQFEVLAGRPFVTAHARLLFPWSPGAQDRFVEEVTVVASAFIEARTNLHQLFMLSLSALVRAGQGGAARQPLVEALADLASRLSQPERVWDACVNPAAPETAARPIRSLPEFSPERSAHDPGNELNRRARVLQKALTEHPRELAAALLELDRWVSAKGGRWRFGLARDPSERTEGLLPANLSVVLYEASAAVGGSFEGGRLLTGIETLVEDYLEASQSPLAERGPKEATRRILLDALVGFAQKLVFLSNNSALLGKGDNEKVTRPYALVLQAVGNAILIQIDELRKFESHQTAQRSRASAEADAAVSTKLLDDKGSELLSKQPFLSAEDVRRQLLSMLRYERAAALKAGRSDQVAQLDLAVRAVTEIHNDEIYLRPASAYLRNSHPATSLQHDSSGVEWQNMLGQHAARQIPVLNSFPNRFTSGGRRKRDRVLQKQIDKQFWQNINSVRLAGTGNANYVVVKDDVGNWYVKSYAANAEDIYRSARGLASFAYGGGVAAQMPAALPKPTKETAVPSNAVVASSLREEFNRAQRTFDTNVTRLQHDLAVCAEAMRGTLRTAWEEQTDIETNRTTLDGLEHTAWTNHLARVSEPANGTKPSRPAPALLDQLASLSRYSQTLRSSILEHASLPDDLRRKAARTVASKVRPILMDFLDPSRRLFAEQSARYETLTNLEAEGGGQ